MKEKIPIILSLKITKLNPPYFWLGGGEVDLKLRLYIKEFIQIMKPFITDISLS